MKPLENRCAAASGAGTAHSGAASGAETWTAEGSPHTLADDFTIPKGASVTLAPCAVVRVAGGKSIKVEGTLAARGEDGSPAVITAQDAASPWGSIEGGPSAGGLDLHFLLVEAGGALPSGSYADLHGAIRATATKGALPVEVLRIDHVEVRGSATNGLVLADGALFTTDSDGLLVTKSDRYAVVGEGMGVSGLPAGLYTGNGIDAVLVRTNARLGVDGARASVTFRNRGVPYVIGSDDRDTEGMLTVGAPNGEDPTTLTIEAGVTMKFGHGRDRGIEVMSSPRGGASALIAVGTAEAPIVFTSASPTPAAGDWLGVTFRGSLRDDNKLDRVTIEYAGGIDTNTSDRSCGTPLAPRIDQTQTMGALYFALESPPKAAFLTNSTIKDSASNGVDRGWIGADVDFRPTNTFQNITYCVQTQPKPEAGLCPDAPSCPKE